jgi:AAA family ATPase
MRPGRLDRILYVGAPDFATRKEIFRIRLAKMAIEPSVDIAELARSVSVLSLEPVEADRSDRGMFWRRGRLDLPRRCTNGYERGPERAIRE